MTFAKPVVGQKLWFVPDGRRREAREVTVKKVGRVWFEIEGEPVRFSVATGLCEPTGFGSGTIGHLWRTREQYEARQEVERAWFVLVEEIDRRAVPQGLTLEEIESARRILKLR